ncbi:MAG TPA: hypothetical protein DEO32_00290 [Ruminococcaceae bacterium]|nr:hypothetical protein [Oscillospiraceae bacterium]
MDLPQIIYFSIEIWGAFFSLIAALTILLTRHFDKSGSRKLMLAMLCSAALMTCDGISVFFRGNVSQTGNIIERWSTFAVYFLSFLIIPLSAQYVSQIIYKRSGGFKLYWELVEWGIFIFGAVMLIINEIFPFIFYIDDASHFVRMPYFFWLPSLIGFTGILTTLAVALQYSRYMLPIERAAVVSFLTLPLFGIIIKLFNPETPFVTIALVISVIILFVSYEASYVQFLVEKEKKLSEDKLKLVNRQMQPHFIFNTLTLIRFQCLTAPNDAAQTVSEFSNYLRGITDYLTEEDCISVEAELEIVKNYLLIQSKRFGDGIKVEYDIRETDFEVPPFSIQTLTENAVHHGFKSGQSKGTVRISTKKDDNKRIVTVEDNGVGFDTNELKNKEKSSVGITNTRNRVEIMCKGELIIESEPGKGTHAVIVIPE